LTKKQRIVPGEKGGEILRELRESVAPKQHIDRTAQLAVARAMDHAKLLADLGNEDAFVKQIRDISRN